MKKQAKILCSMLLAALLTLSVFPSYGGVCVTVYQKILRIVNMCAGRFACTYFFGKVPKSFVVRTARCPFFWTSVLR